MAKDKIEKKLDQLVGFRQAHDSSVTEVEDVIEQALMSCPDLKQRYDNLQKEIKFVSESERKLTSEIKEAVLKGGVSVKGELLHAIYSKGRTTWDGTKLEGFAIAHPEINECKKVGGPSVAIRG